MAGGPERCWAVWLPAGAGRGGPTDGITDIDKVDVSRELVRVPVTTSGGTEVRVYRPAAASSGWQRVS